MVRSAQATLPLTFVSGQAGAAPRNERGGSESGNEAPGQQTPGTLARLPSRVPSGGGTHGVASGLRGHQALPCLRRYAAAPSRVHPLLSYRHRLPPHRFSADAVRSLTCTLCCFCIISCKCCTYIAVHTCTYPMDGARECSRVLGARECSRVLFRRLACTPCCRPPAFCTCPRSPGSLARWPPRYAHVTARASMYHTPRTALRALYHTCTMAWMRLTLETVTHAKHLDTASLAFYSEENSRSLFHAPFPYSCAKYVDVMLVSRRLWGGVRASRATCCPPRPL